VESLLALLARRRAIAENPLLFLSPANACGALPLMLATIGAHFRSVNERIGDADARNALPPPALFTRFVLSY
jgi:hypothetical protein